MTSQTHKCITEFNQKQLGFYLAGLLEGDGWVGEKAIHISFHSKDQYSAEKLIEALHLGKIYRKKGKSCVVQIASKEGLKRVLELTNGKFVGPFKINQFLKHNYEERFNIKISPSTNTVCSNNAWFTGFFEADGSALISIKNTKRYRLGKSTLASLDVAQKERLLLDLIVKGFFSSFSKGPSIHEDNSKATFSKSAYNGHRFTITSLKQLPIWFKYFDEFPLQGRKYGQVLKVQECFNLMLEKKHLTSNGLAEVYRLQKELRELELPTVKTILKKKPFILSLAQMEQLDELLTQIPRLPFEQIAKKVTVSRSTFYNYRKKPEDFKRRLVQFTAQEKQDLERKVL